MMNDRVHKLCWQVARSQVSLRGNVISCRLPWKVCVLSLSEFPHFTHLSCSGFDRWLNIVRSPLDVAVLGEIAFHHSALHNSRKWSLSFDDTLEY